VPPVPASLAGIEVVLATAGDLDDGAGTFVGIVAGSTSRVGWWAP